MEEDQGKARGNGRPEGPKTGARRPGEELPADIQPSEKREKHSPEGSPPSPEPSTSVKEEPEGEPSPVSEEKPQEAEAGPSPSDAAEPGPAPAVAPAPGGPVGAGGERGGRPGAGDRPGRPKRGPSYEIVHTRPSNVQSKRGVSGSEVILQANYFRILKKPSWNLYQYAVSYNPPVELDRVRKGMLSEHKALIGGYLFDGAMLFATQKLPDEVTEINMTSRSGEPQQITIKFTGIVSMSESRSLQVLNLILRKAMEGLKLQLVGRNFFDAVSKIDIREYKLQLWPGYTTSIRQHEKDVLLCAEIAHKVMRTETVYDILQKCIHESRDYQDNFKKQVIGMTVLTDYNNKTYRIDDVDFNSNPKKTFETKDGPTSFVDYYYKKYHIRIRDPGQPVLLSRSKEKQLRSGQSDLIILIPELCRVTGLGDAMRTNMQLMLALGRHTRLAPDMRIERLKAFNRRLLKSEQSVNVLKEWQMSLDPNLVEFKGRMLKPENIVFGEGSKVPAENADWTRSLRDHAPFTSVDLRRMYVIAPNRSMREANDFVRCLIEAARGMRMNIAQPRIQQIHDDRNSSYINAIESCCQHDPQLIMCVVPNNNAERYSSIKKKTCVDRAIPTQVMCHKTITPRGGNVRGLMSIATKVAIQINCKLGAAAWMIDLPLSGLMTIGYDIAKSSKDKSKSFGALVATMDMKSAARYYSSVSSHRNGEELSNELTISVTKALKEFRNLHGKLPNRILFYRDGVGDGQIQHVLEHEVNILKNKLKAIYKSENVEAGPRFAFVIVSKKINTRLFSRGRNPNAGTVVDDVVTLPERYDFYLVSQTVRQGTVSPTSYNVIYDTMGLDPDKMQILTYKMTHLYYNWSGTTRVPAVCQYAQKLASLVGASIHQSPSNLLEKQLYFL
uniref:Piwib n=1 Tax=Tabanus bromius TaxID=304241 RepID=A0A0K8TM02_TABBR